MGVCIGCRNRLSTNSMDHALHNGKQAPCFCQNVICIAQTKYAGICTFKCGCVRQLLRASTRNHVALPRVLAKLLAVFNPRLAALRALFTVAAARVSVADVQPAALFADNMIIQRETQAPV